LGLKNKIKIQKMFVITKDLVQKMDEMLLKAFLKKVERFIIENVREQIISDIDLTQFIVQSIILQK
jgi:hypothetical protein